MLPPFLDALKAGPLVLDGAMGTQLYERGVFINKSLEEACLTNPALVQQVHEEYIRAGAQVIQTHTFGANRPKLARYGIEERFEEINRTAVRMAREARDQAGRGQVYIGGSVGPSGWTPALMSDAELVELKAVFRDQMTLLLGEGVDILILETFRLLSEMRVALEVARELTDIPIVAQMAFDADARTMDGANPKRAARLLVEWGADVIGANCVEGPVGVFEAVKDLVGHGVPVSAVPNAGYPRLEDDRLIYMATAEYFGIYARRFFKAGVAMVGGCCGTAPEHIQRIAGAARMMGGGRAQVVHVVSAETESDEAVGLTPTPLAEKSPLAEKVARVQRERILAADPVPLSPESFVVSVEVNPPSGLDPSKALDAARMLQSFGVDAINIADGPRASVRMSNQALALLARDTLGIEVILHVCCRDRNLLGLQSDLLANHVLGLHNLVIITGDPPKLGDYPHATAVFDLDSVGLLRLVDGLNKGFDPAGKSVGQQTAFFSACGAEPAALDYDREIRRLEQKRQNGAEMIMTQPVYDPKVLERFLDDTQHLEMPVLVGLLPLASHRNAEFLHNEVPGMQIPAYIRERMREVGKGPAARTEGVKIAQECLMAVTDRVVGAYIMPPFGRYRAALEILECVGYEVPEAPAESAEKQSA